MMMGAWRPDRQRDQLLPARSATTRQIAAKRHRDEDKKDKKHVAKHGDISQRRILQLPGDGR